MAGMTLEGAWPAVFTQAEAELLEGIAGASVSFPSRKQILRTESATDSVLYLSAGFVGRYRCDRLGRRQFMGIQVPGDYLDLPGFFMGRLDANAEALGPVEVQAAPAERLRALESEAPAIAEKLWRISMIDAAISRHWVYRIGRLGGRARIASFFCEMLLRLYARGLCPLDRFELPLTQTDLAEANGMTSVHVNRLLGELRAEGICTFAQGIVEITNLPELFQTGQYRWDYLYLGADLTAEIQERLSSPRRGAIRTGMVPKSGTT